MKGLFKSGSIGAKSQRIAGHPTDRLKSHYVVIQIAKTQATSTCLTSNQSSVRTAIYITPSAKREPLLLTWQRMNTPSESN